MSTASHRAPPNKWLVTLSVSCGTLMGAIDASIVNVALPQIRGSLGATLQESTWATTSFIIATVIVMPLTGLMGRLFGQKRAYLACLALFIVSSLLCGIAWNLPSLVIFRALQGLGAGALTPIEQSILRQTFPPREQGMAMAIFSMVIITGPTIGPTLGGYIVDHAHWSWIFLINLPVGLLGFLLVWRFVEEPEDVSAANRAAAELQRRHMDWAGIGLLSVGLAALQFMFEEGHSKEWFDSGAITACAVVAGLCLFAFVLHELSATAPVVDMRLFKDPVFASGALLGVIIFLVITTNLFLLSLFMQEQLGFTAMHAGLALMPRTLLMMVTMPIVGRLYGRVSTQLLIGAGLLLSGLGVYQMGSVTLDTTARDIVGSLVLQGLGASLIFVPLNTVVFENVPRARVADAAGVALMLRHVGSSLSLAIFASLLPRYAAQAQGAIATHVVAERPEVLQRLALVEGGLLARGMDMASAHEASLRLLADSVLRQAMVMAFDRLFLLSALLYAVSLPLVLLLRTSAASRASQKVHVEVEV